MSNLGTATTPATTNSTFASAMYAILKPSDVLAQHIKNVDTRDPTQRALMLAQEAAHENAIRAQDLALSHRAERAREIAPSNAAWSQIAGHTPRVTLASLNAAPMRV